LPIRTVFQTSAAFDRSDRALTTLLGPLPALRIVLRGIAELILAILGWAAEMEGLTRREQISARRQQAAVAAAS